MSTATCYIRRIDKKNNTTVKYWVTNPVNYIITVEKRNGTVTAYHVGWKGDRHAFLVQPRTTHEKLITSLGYSITNSMEPFVIPWRFLINHAGEYFPQNTRVKG